MRGLGVAVGAAIGMLAAACSVPPKLEVLNRSGRHIVVPLNGGAWGLGSRKAQLPSGALELIGFWRLRGPGLRLRAGGCEYRYDIPRFPSAPPSYALDVALVVQVEPDFTIHYLPTGTTEPQDVTTIAFRQPEGFPLRPASKDCG